LPLSVIPKHLPAISTGQGRLWRKRFESLLSILPVLTWNFHSS